MDSGYFITALIVILIVLVIVALSFYIYDKNKDSKSGGDSKNAKSAKQDTKETLNASSQQPQQAQQQSCQPNYTQAQPQLNNNPLINVSDNIYMGTVTSTTPAELMRCGIQNIITFSRQQPFSSVADHCRIHGIPIYSIQRNMSTIGATINELKNNNEYLYECYNVIERFSDQGLLLYYTADKDVMPAIAMYRIKHGMPFEQAASGIHDKDILDELRLIANPSAIVKPRKHKHKKHKKRHKLIDV